MCLLDVSFGIFVFHPIGWIFMIFIIFCEAIILSRYLTNHKFNKRIYLTELLSNMTSGIIGIIATLKINGGWWLVMWYPWVSSHEVNIQNRSQLIGLIIYYFVAFILSVLIELIINYFCLRKNFSAKKIYKGTMRANLATYAIGAILLAILVQ